MQRVLTYDKQYEWLFLSQINEKSTEEHAKAISEKRKTVTQYDKRIFELDSLFQRLYEDSVANRISEERFLKMSAAYETEQAELKRKYAELEAELDEEKQTVANTERFLSIIRSYTEIDALSPTILHDFIEKIVIHAPDKSIGKRKQKVEIYYNSVGIIDIPSQDEMVELLKERKEQRLAEQSELIKTA